MKSTKMRILFASTLSLVLLSACSSIESSAQEDCTSIGWQIGTPGYNDCYRARLYERRLDYSLPPGDRPRPSLI
ncbi:hypothetical protein [Polynucleobacter sp. AP-Latsch-80-C2]|uniref:hypothetical protein n=1 Tax=Polynucleobacter sp. AP-Latsch-80-C2 TaxID=2576931 RepID=UPI001C0DBD26|nr:hypothetical protein [Polynucleobacter sp. AP-Latsch-80-C2]MBU3623407.1 hypothetical protein [Polynucleobacter sp. AP-Latsch-80-C2]